MNAHEQERITLTTSCQDCAALPKVPGAGSVDPAGPWPVQTMHNGIRVAADGYCGQWMTQIISTLQGHHEPQEEKVFARVMDALGTAGCMVELGSYWAYYSIWFKSRFPESSVILVEPDPHYLEIGQYNFALNGFDGKFIPAAVARQASLPIPFACESDGKVRAVPCVSVDGITADTGMVDLLLADIQGAELPMLEGMTRLLEEGRLRVLFLSTHGEAISGDSRTHQKCLAWLKARGAHIMAEHNVAESYSGDGLIVASFDPALRFDVEISHRPARAGTGDSHATASDPDPVETPAAEEVRFVSYAQNGEDVLLWRALGQVQNGFYIDIGAYHPLMDSVTQAFYERGWHGINVEPVPSNAASFVAPRPRDLTLMVAASNETGSRLFYEVEGSGLSTFDDKELDLHRQAGWTVREHTVPTATLAEICRLHGAPEIHFLKIDAEESERQVLEGADFATFRPWIILVESVLPNSSMASHHAWEPLLLEAGYEFLFFDGLNRWYASREKAEAMRPHFDRPANPLDHFVTYREKCLEQKLARVPPPAPPAPQGPSPAVARLKQQVSELRAAVKQLETKLQYHAVNPARALKLWWNRRQS